MEERTMWKILLFFGKNKEKQKKEQEVAVIKGNINSKGNKIYHIPEGRFYEVIQNPIALFKTEQEAEQAGYRRSRM